MNAIDQDMADEAELTHLSINISTSSNKVTASGGISWGGGKLRRFVDSAISAFSNTWSWEAGAGPHVLLRLH